MRLLLICFITLLGTAAAWATQVDLKDGRVIEGKVIEQTTDKVKLDVNGIPMTYYSDEIKDVDGKAWVSPDAPPSSVLVASDVSKVGESSGVDAKKKALILKFIDLFGTRQLLQQNFENMLSRIPASQAADAAKLRDRINIDEIIEQLIPVYDQNFSTEDLQFYVNFYDSPQGRRLLDTLPNVMKESVDVSIKYIESKFPELQRQFAK